MSARHIASTLAVAVPAAMIASAAAAQPAEARLEALERALAAQQQTIERQQAEIDQLRRQVQAGQPAPQQAAAAPTPAPASLETRVAALQAAADQQKLVEQDRARLSFVGGRPTIASPDGRNTMIFRGLVQMETANYGQAAEGPAATDFRRGSVGAGGRETNAAKDLSDGAYFRRARFGVEGVFNREFGYRLVYELAGSGTEGPARINDAWISYTGFAPFTLQIGAFSPPANMDDGTSPEDTLFVERATASELSRTLGGADGRLGIGVKTATARWMGALTLTSRTVNDAEVFDSQTAIVGRVGRLLLTSDDYNVHVGASGTYVFSPADMGSSAGAASRRTVRFRDRPEVRVDGARLVDTGPIAADHAFAAGAEFGAQYKNFYLQTELFRFGVDRPGAARTAKFGGYYVQGSWVLTGEPRRYNMASGSFQNPRPYSPFSRAGGRGAWELAARYSTVDLDFDSGIAGAANPVGGIRGGEQEIWTVGLNWYPNPNLKLMLNYLNIGVDRLNPAGPDNAAPFGAAPATPPVGVQIGQDAEAIVLRSQFSF